MAKKKQNNKGTKIIKKYLELFYMTPQIVSAKDISLILKEVEHTQIELWEDMNVLELILSNGNSIDIEPIKTDFKNPSDMAFVKNRDIKTIFAVTVCEDDIEEVKDYFKVIKDKIDGFLCSDSEDFKPFYVS